MIKHPYCKVLQLNTKIEENIYALVRKAVRDQVFSLKNKRTGLHPLEFILFFKKVELGNYAYKTSGRI